MFAFPHFCLYEDVCACAHTESLGVCVCQASVFAWHMRAAIPDLGEQESRGKGGWNYRPPSDSGPELSTLSEWKHSGSGRKVLKKTVTHFCFTPHWDKDKPRSVKVMGVWKRDWKLKEIYINCHETPGEQWLTTYYIHIFFFLCDVLLTWWVLAFDQFVFIVFSHSYTKMALAFCGSIECDWKWECACPVVLFSI